MTITEIEHMWKIASNDPNHDYNWNDAVVVAFANLVAQHEREKFCAALRQLHDSYSLASDSNAIKAALEAKDEPQYIAFMDTPQRTWVGLTDEDMGFLFPHGKSAWVQEIVKIIEHKLKEKNT